MASGLLLIVLPGRSGREAVLRRIRAEVGPLALLVPRNLLAASQWAQPLAESWIETESLDLNDAWRAVCEWMASGHRLAGVTTWDEWGIEICAHLCEQLALPYTPLNTVRQVRDKVRFRELCRAAGVPYPRFRSVQSREELDLGGWSFPVILKPAKGAGSYYCRRVESQEELLDVFPVLDRLRNEGKTPKEDALAGWILEEWFQGQEVDVDGWAAEGVVQWMLVSDNRPVLSAACCEQGGIYPSQLPWQVVEKLEELTREVVKATKQLHSAFHFEALVNTETQEVMPVELNLRVGGAEAPACVEAVSGVSLPLAAAALALRRTVPRGPPSAPVAASSNEYAAAAGVVEACEARPELHEDPDFLAAAFFGSKGARYQPFEGSMSCLAWLCATGGDAEEASANLRRCLSKCRIEVTPG